MDPNRFDSFAKKLGTRLSRRDMVRVGAATAVGAIAVGKFSSIAAQDPGTTAKDRFIAVRTYAYTGTEQDAATGLAGLIPVMEQQPGFISYNLVFGKGQILAVSTFLDETTAVAAAQQENSWIAANASTILTSAPTIQSGDVFLRSELHAGCGCITGTQNACDSERLTCCATTDRMGGPGICLTTETTCPGAMPAEPTATPVPAQPTATTAPACTGEGCACNGGVQGNCDSGLTCCGVTVPGGPGTCTANCPCTGDGCACTTGEDGNCDDGLVCCAADMTDPGSPGTCMASCDSSDCNGQENCPCTAGTDGACNDGLECCGADTPGGQGTCQSSCNDGGCTSDGCDCTTGEDGNCDDGLVCCAADMTDPGSPGTCMSTCDSSDCNGQEGCPCDSGTENACNDGLECCDTDGVPGGQGTCSSSCDS